MKRYNAKKIEATSRDNNILLQWILSDRFLDKTLAEQICGCETEIINVLAIHRISRSYNSSVFPLHIHKANIYYV